MRDDDLSRAQWKKSSYSGNSGNCVEAAISEHVVGVRDSNELDGPVIVVSSQGWKRFVRTLKAGQLRG